MTNKRYAITMTAGIIAGCALMGTLAFTPMTLTEDATPTPEVLPTPTLIELPDCAIGEEAIPTDTGYTCGPADVAVPEDITPLLDEVLTPEENAYADGYATAEEQMDIYYRASWEEAIATPCVMEDDPNCYWLGSEQGNGQGDSFINLGGTYYYIGQETQR